MAAAAVQTQQTNELPAPASTIVSAGIGYLACRIFTTINPYAGAILGVVSDTVDHMTKPFFYYLEGGETTSKAHKNAVKIIKFLTNITATSYLTNYFIKFTAIELLKTSAAMVALPWLAAAIIIGTVLSIAVPIFAYNALSYNR